ncbi:MerR family transcriptional regulator [Sulfitobacter mediterraneus]|uniref:MerR family transcriptional regulator n=1 Tax=Sulfitobacter mediterraneus TaxID=83219 RepID=UPI001932D805|nr:MerR family transcriptional regulator [Sulfitobacter mediterraneus]MBM1632039.1 MerR family transcriptional regulator [Sulfitobacter mediterraneus]MBM1639854.1 MerR family transcriptional regulator [Sulfitobacter mediterraneus]MBM1643903.1 MerR family transcriptional regulator [Sulfitobacter mediterraneus]MBM1647949.1 MerR family transcriptional regulator [Sulfitobacter mediterraneus]MBM1651994.1 MerR family transcriptional regulator [Sulfitobacter mediterraneus]
MRIGELAKRAKVSRDTIRFYERHGLIRSDVDPEAGNSYRIYPEDAVLTLDVIRDAQAAGLSIADISMFLAQFLAQAPETEAGQGFLETKIAEVRSRQEAGARFLQMLEQTKAALDRAPQDGLDEMTSRAKE